MTQTLFLILFFGVIAVFYLVLIITPNLETDFGKFVCCCLIAGLASISGAIFDEFLHQKDVLDCFQKVPIAHEGTDNFTIERLICIKDGKIERYPYLPETVKKVSH